MHSLLVEAVGSPADLQGVTDGRAHSPVENRRHTLQVGDGGYSGCMDIGGRTITNSKLALHLTIKSDRTRFLFTYIASMTRSDTTFSALHGEDVSGGREENRPTQVGSSSALEVPGEIIYRRPRIDGCSAPKRA